MTHGPLKDKGHPEVLSFGRKAIAGTTNHSLRDQLNRNIHLQGGEKDQPLHKKNLQGPDRDLNSTDQTWSRSCTCLWTSSRSSQTNRPPTQSDIEDIERETSKPDARPIGDEEDEDDDSSNRRRRRKIIPSSVCTKCQGRENSCNSSRPFSVVWTWQTRRCKCRVYRDKLSHAT